MAPFPGTSARSDATAGSIQVKLRPRALERRRIAEPTKPKPAIINAQLAGSGTAGNGVAEKSTVASNPVSDPNGCPFDLAKRNESTSPEATASALPEIDVKGEIRVIPLKTETLPNEVAPKKAEMS
jgi:hypothetical protein